MENFKNSHHLRYIGKTKIDRKTEEKRDGERKRIPDRCFFPRKHKYQGK
jgi:hypothetical protein